MSLSTRGKSAGGKTSPAALLSVSGISLVSQPHLVILILAAISISLLAAWGFCSGSFSHVPIATHRKQIVVFDNFPHGHGKQMNSLSADQDPGLVSSKDGILAGSAESAARHSTVDLASFPLPHFDASQIHPGTFAYLVMGEGNIAKSWVQMARYKNVYLFFLSYRIVCPEKSSQKFHALFYPNSTWASGRNKLLDMAVRFEIKHGWRFEYLIFCDDDVRLIQRNNQTTYNLKTNLQAHYHLRQLLLRDRPARAGIEFPGYREYIPDYPMPCVTSCGYDAAVDVFHRTVVPYLLPYTQAFDSFNWWMSSETSSYRSAAMFGPFCNNYREIVHDPLNNKHREYPAQPKFKEKAVAAFLWCLARLDVPPQIWENFYAYGTQRPGIPGEQTCAKQKQGVNYGKLIPRYVRELSICTALTRYDEFPKALWYASLRHSEERK